MITHNGGLPENRYADLRRSPKLVTQKFNKYKTKRHHSNTRNQSQRQTARQRDSQIDKHTHTRLLRRQVGIKELNRYDHNVESYITKYCDYSRCQLIARTASIYC